MNILRPLKVLCGLLCGFAGALHAAPLSASIPMLAEAPLAGDCSPTEVGRVARAEMEARLNAYLQLSEEALSMRFQAIKLYAELEAKMRRKEALSGRDFQRVNQGAVDLVAQRELLLQTATRHECWLDATAPADAEGLAIYRAGLLISLSSALILYDNYVQAFLPYRNHAELRRHINAGDKGFGWTSRELRQAELMFNSPQNRRRARRAVDWYQGLVAKPLNDVQAQAGFAAEPYLRLSIAQSPAFQLVTQSENPLRVIGRVIQFFSDVTSDTAAHLGAESVNFSSKLFGNTVGLVETRHGKLYERADVRADLLATLQAGDILLEKTPFRLTDNFIPGHWGHAAIWIGTKAELQALGLWEHPLVKARHAEIEAGQGVVEALRTGVEMNTLARFLNVDDVAVLRQTRPVPPAAEERGEVILQTLRQVGKSYDFNFDVESTQRMFCSKLVYHGYPRITWPTSRMLGRFTVSPDDIAKRALADGPLEIPLLYHDGGKVAGDYVKAMERLLKDSNAAVAMSAAGKPAGK
ncbi:MAG: hypothetical protein LBU53_03710 [Zoogloeaceae bacterium]|jgi:uncharacterized protein YycO|nr:hypothetical protein [Zoogloeaceae bacterium]